MGQYKGTSHKLVEVGAEKGDWSFLLQYLERLSKSHRGSQVNPTFDTPLKPDLIATEMLAAELMDPQGLHQDETPIIIAIKLNAPIHIIAALCQMSKESLGVADRHGRLPLHLVCQRPTTSVAPSSSKKDDDKTDTTDETDETQEIMKLLIEVYPEGLVAQNNYGHTPLHELLLHHAETRSVVVVTLFLKTVALRHFEAMRVAALARAAQTKATASRSRKSEQLPPLPDIPTPTGKQVPPSAAIVPETKDGAIPLTVAVQMGASKQVIQALIRHYPGSVNWADRYHRTALHYYLGVNTSDVSGCEATLPGVKSEGDDDAIQDLGDSRSWNILLLLANESVCKTKDETCLNRLPLHWAVHVMALSLCEEVTNAEQKKKKSASNNVTGPMIGCMPIKSLKLLIAFFEGALITKDVNGHTPLHVLFHTVYTCQQRDWQVYGKRAMPFDPPCDLLSVLKQQIEITPVKKKGSASVDSGGAVRMFPSHMQDDSGWLPLHYALGTSTSARTLATMIRSFPQALLHASKSGQTPLHTALGSPWSTPDLELGTITLMLHPNHSRLDIDGRQALKMKDSTGSYPLHLASENDAHLDILEMILNAFPSAATMRNQDGDLPLHLLMDKSDFFRNLRPHDPVSEDRHTMTRGSSGAVFGMSMNDQDDPAVLQKKMIIQQKFSSLLLPLLPARESDGPKTFRGSREDADIHLSTPSSTHGMLPLHIAIAFDAATYETIHELLRAYPAATRHRTSAQGFTYTPLDLHLMRRGVPGEVKPDMMDEWHAIRELLFAYGPLVSRVYTNDKELLNRCVDVIRSEVFGSGSMHSIEDGTKWSFSHNKDTFNDQQQEDEEENPECASPVKTIMIPFGENTPSGTKERLNRKKHRSKSRSTRDPHSSLGPYEDDATISSGSTYTKTDLKKYQDDDRKWATTEESRLIEEDDNRSPPDDLDARESTEQNFQREQTKEKNAYDLEANMHKNSLSDVAERMWTFFMLHTVPSDLDVHYSKLIEKILADFTMEDVERLIHMQVPQHARPEGSKILTIRDAANVHCRAVVYGAFLFAGAYDLHLPDEEGAKRSANLLHKTVDGKTLCFYAEECKYCVEDDVLATLPSGDSTKVSVHASDWKRGVCIKFMKDRNAFECEVKNRASLILPCESEESYVVPIFEEFDTEQNRESDQRYRRDIQNKRYSKLLAGSHEVNLSEYPYAIVMPLSKVGNMYDLFLHGSILGQKEVRNAVLQIGKAVQQLHQSGTLHGNINMQNVLSLSPVTQKNDTDWMLTNLTVASRIPTPEDEDLLYAGAIRDGSIEFATGTLPPEMFIQLTKTEADAFKTHWDTVKQKHGFDIRAGEFEPFIESRMGETYVVKCFFISDSNKRNGSLPYLPFESVVKHESFDIWAFGLLIFEIYSNGCPLFPTNKRTGHLSSYDEICKWSYEEAKRLVYTHVEDPLAQDLLLQLLSPYEERQLLRMSTVLDHPFFTDYGATSENTKLIVEERKIDCGDYRIMVPAENGKTNTFSSREARSTNHRGPTLPYMSLDAKLHMLHAPSYLMREMLGASNNAPNIPYSLIILPYKLVRNSNKKLTPATKKDVERAEKMGKHMLGLSKMCFFVKSLQHMMEENKKASELFRRWIDRCVHYPKAVAKDICLLLEIPEAYMDIASTVVFTAKEKDENPLYVARGLILANVRAIIEIFQSANKGYTYLVDEYACTPVFMPNDNTYPHVVRDNDVTDVVLAVLPFMQMTILQARGIAGGIQGLVKLIFEQAYPAVPGSWETEGKELRHELAREEMIEEVQLLHSVLQDGSIPTKQKGNRTNLGDERLRSIQTYLESFDVDKKFAGLKQVSEGDSFMWTVDEKIEEIQTNSGVDHLISTYRARQEEQRTIEEQSKIIKYLEREIRKIKLCNSPRRTPNNSTSPRAARSPRTGIPNSPRGARSPRAGIPTSPRMARSPRAGMPISPRMPTSPRTGSSRSLRTPPQSPNRIGATARASPRAGSSKSLGNLQTSDTFTARKRIDLRIDTT